MIYYSHIYMQFGLHFFEYLMDVIYDSTDYWTWCEGEAHCDMIACHCMGGEL